MATCNLPLTLEALNGLELTLKCNICTEILCDPILIGRCEHVFCKKCVSQFSSDVCPECHVPVAAKDTHNDLQLTVLLSMCQQLRSILTKNECPPATDITVEDKCKNTFSIEGKVVDIAIDSSPHCSPTEENEKINLIHVTPVQKKKSLTSMVNKEMETPKIGKSGLNIFAKRPSLYFPKSCSLRSGNCRKRIRGFSAKKFKEKKNTKGETMLHVATIKGNFSKAKELLLRGADPNVKDNAGWTPLHEASNHGFKEIVELLLDFGACINVPGHDNVTPLHDAIQNGRLEVAQILALRGADLQAKNSQGQTPLDLCPSKEVKESLVDACVSYICQNDSSPSKSPTVSYKCSDKIVFLSTGLDNPQKEKLQQCVKLLKAQIVEEFNSDVTHIIATCDDMGQCNRTLKVLQGILAGKWILNFAWIELCLEYNQKVSEEVYEVPGIKHLRDTNGPKRARENAIQQYPPLFDGCKFYLSGQFCPPAPKREDICSLIQEGGGKILTREPRLESIDLEKLEVPYHVSSSRSLAGASYFVLYQFEPPRLISVSSGPIRTVSFAWLIDSISAFQLLDPENVEGQRMC